MWRESHLGYYSIFSKLWRKADPIRSRNSQNTWARNNREKRAAYDAVKYALKKGKLARQPCEVCGISKTHAHHSDYSKPLDVIWLCSFHHGNQHRKP
jgi:hypothetical protein